MNTITLDCNAKINLALDVLGKRDDGYHDVELILHEIPLCDTVTVALRYERGITLQCDDPSLPCGSGNLAFRAAAQFFEHTRIPHGADIKLIKRVPSGAGLAGGSSDAAGVLKALNELCGNPLNDSRLAEIGAGIGADVPFFIRGGCALAEGIGDILTPLPEPPKFIYVIAKPSESVSTKWVYENLSLDNRPPDLCVQAVAEGIRRGDTEMFLKNTGNILESVTAARFPIIDKIKQTLSENGALLAMMSGSGTAVFGIFDNHTAAAAAASTAKMFTNEVYII